MQVTADISNVSTREREIRSYMPLNDQIEKIIVVNKPIKASMDESGIAIVGIAEFILNYIKD